MPDLLQAALSHLSNEELRELSLQKNSKGKQSVTANNAYKLLQKRAGVSFNTLKHTCSRNDWDDRYQL